MEKNMQNLLNYFPEFEELITSKQFEYAQRLINKRIHLDLSFAKVAEIAGFTPEAYISLEYGEASVPSEQYEAALFKLDQYEKKLETQKITQPANYLLSPVTYTNKEKNSSSKEFVMHDMKWVA